jgi:guanine deaminase
MVKELFVGTFVHSLSLAQLEIGENGVIGVNNGKIVFIEKQVKDLEAIKKAHDFEGVKTTILSGSQFLLPGFIDCHIVRL